ncbi:uncharacterized protein FPRN_02990 [Fusarium proliferatum]|nr:uncharacterized protein FPRN_02990 [Fusarium proliferatum]
MSIIASVGYKFAIVSPDDWTKENFHPRLVGFIKSELSAVKNGSPSHGSMTFRFMMSSGPLLASVRSGASLCSNRADQFYPGDVGTLHTREVVLVANDSVGKGDFYTAEDPGHWHRMETTSTNWFHPPQRALVEYRPIEFGSLQTQ